MIGQLKNNNINNNNKCPQKKTSQSPSSSIYSNSLLHNIPLHFDNISDPTSQQETIQELLKISNIKDGFYIGDKISAISLEVINEFKITHIINTTGNQIINQWESIGIKYLTINWSESPNQILFDLKDELAEKIVEFIDKGLSIGEGVLAHSFNGKNRVCLVALIYLMKKYKWSLLKSLQYLKSKKNDVEITNYFYNQLENFQKRLIQKGELTRDIPWEFENLIDEEEKLMRNTYMNCLPPEKNVNLQEKNNNRIIDLLVGNGNNNNLNKNINLKHIIWADNSPYTYHQGKIEIYNLSNDLCLKKDIKNITCHQKCKPIKPCIKNYENKFSDIKFNINIKNNNINIIKQKINFDCPDRNAYRNEYSNKIEYNNQLNIDILKKEIININDIDKNISNNNTNSNTPALQDKIENKSTDIDNNNFKNKFNFNIGSLNSLNSNNINNFGFLEETPKINNEINNQNRINIINYTPINMNMNNNNSNKKIIVITKANKGNNNNQKNIKGGYNKKNINNGNKNVLTKPLNNFNPNLIKRKNQNSSKDYPSSHPLFNKNKENAPVKIKNYNNYSNVKKPTTPVLSSHSNSSNIISKDNFNSSQTSSLRYNSTNKFSSPSNNFNSTSPGISFNKNNLNLKNNVYNQNKLKNSSGINFNSNLNTKINKNKSGGVKSKVNQRPLSAENKNKYKNNFDKNYIINNKQNNMKLNNYYNNNKYGTRNCNFNSKDLSKGINQNNIKTSNNYQQYNFAKQRRPSPVIKSQNILNKKANK